MNSSTVRSAVDPTISESAAKAQPPALQKLITAEWRKSGRADLVLALRRHPILLRDKSLLLNLAIEEYKAQSGTALDEHCRRFLEFGSSIHRSILRQLEAQRYIDGHPELLDIFSSPTWPKAGEQFGDFHVIEELGFGAAAHVYLCLQPDVGFRHVVVKAAAFSSFEASILGRLNHPNIIRIHSTGSIDESNLHFICMPYCGRSTLADVLDVGFQDGCPRGGDCIAIAARRWTPEEEWSPEQQKNRTLAVFRARSYVDGALKIAIKIADALQHAHERGILHGDLKPSNVLLTPDARPLLLDVNLSQEYPRSPGMCGGTLPYMPPEYLRLVAGHERQDEDQELDVRPDVYSFGALIYELLAGSTPATLPDNVDDVTIAAECILAKLKAGVSPIRRRNPLVSRRLEAIVFSCLEFDPARRPATIQQVRERLRAELRSLAAVGRIARVRPVFFSAIVGLPLALLSGGAAYLALQPARYVVSYEEGLQLSSAGEFEIAAKQFSAAIALNPSFTEARFQLARAQIALNEYDLAISQFKQIVRSENDPHSMAYIGYCFNLNGLPVAAIPWYELAMRNGVRSAAVYNNLGASYIDAQTQKTNEQRVRLADEYLERALALDSEAATIRLNVVRNATARANMDPTYDPFPVWQYASALLKAQPDDPLVRFNIEGWYGLVVTNHFQRNDPNAISDDEKSLRQTFAELQTTAVFRNGGNPSTRTRRYFLEPVVAR